MRNIEIREVSTRKDLKEFIFLPEKVHRNNPLWLPPLYSDEWLLYDPRKNKSFEYCDYIRLIAYKEGKPVGRIMGLINRRYNDIKQEKNGRFCFLEAIDDNDVVNTLLGEIENWARNLGMEKIVGPLAFSDKDPQGLQTEGFEYGAVLSAPTNAAYLPELVKANGYETEVELVDYIATIPDEMPEVHKRVLSMLNRRSDIEILEFGSKKELRPYIIDILQVMNDTYSHIYGFVPLTDKEKKELARRFMPILDPRFIKAVKINGELASFVIAMPDIADGLRKARGRLFPFGFIHILRSVKKSTQLLMLLGAVKEEFRGMGLHSIMGSKVFASAANSKMITLDSHLILAHNKRMRAEYERIGGKVVKRFSIFRKQL
ncbi:MAG: hypothetical protein E4G95_06900 [Bacteroidia bacterium]|nr:MAG: hypothetical protein E4G95_06900 [Bacteroidia bacterium]